MTGPSGRIRSGVKDAAGSAGRVQLTFTDFGTTEHVLCAACLRTRVLHGGTVSNQLPARPNLDHLRSQAKTLLAQLKDGDASAARTFIKHLPAATKLSPAKVRAAGFRLADAQSAVARRSGFESWAQLTKHVEQLRSLEGEWRFVGLQVDGNDMPAAAMTASRLLIDGDRFRMESPEANYDGIFTIDAGAEPMRIDIEFVEGPEAGNS